MREGSNIAAGEAGLANADASSNLGMNERSSAPLQVHVPAILFLLCLVAQLYLVFFKSFNWDEFLHFSFVYELKAGTMNGPFQVLHLRALWWAPEIAANLANQMLAARLFMWGMNLVTLFMIYAVARTFTSGRNAFFAAFAYLTAGYVFTHAFSIRADPFVTATLMGALFLLARGPLGLFKAIVIGVLIGLAGMMTFKAVFYAPCFAGLAWLKSRETPAKLEYLGKLAAVLVVALLTFAAIYFYYGSNAASAANVASAARPVQRTSQLSFYLRWITAGMPFAIYSAKEIILAPVFFLSLALVPFGWRRAGLKTDAKLALSGFIAPLAVLLFYRNTFPYFFVFILAPVAVGIAPSLGFLRDRYGSAFLALVLSAMALALAILEPRAVMGRQRALIDYVHQEFPNKTGYLDYSGMIADYPRILKHLTSGNGIGGYYERGNPVVGKQIERGNVPFIIGNRDVISAALEGRPVPGTFLPGDVAAMRGNYVQQWGVLWREGKYIPIGMQPFEFQVARDGVFVLAGPALTVDGIPLAQGSTIKLAKGRHLAGGKRYAPATLWRGDRLPTTPPNLQMDRVFTNF